MDVKGCYCTKTYIDCSGADFTEISVIYPYITNNTYRIHITGGRIRSLPDDLFEPSSLTGPLDKVTYLNLSGNNIETVGKEAFNQLPRLEILDLSNNDIQVNLCEEKNDLSKSLAPLVNVNELYLRHIFSKEVSGSCDPGNIFTGANMTRLKTLDLSSNGFDLVDSNMEQFLCDSYSIETLNLSRNYFAVLPVSPCMTNVVNLDLSYNTISHLTAEDVDVIQSLVNLQVLKLGGNPFGCDCYQENTYIFLNTTTLGLDFDDIKCSGDSYDSDLVGKPIKRLKYTDMCEEPRIIVCYGPSGQKIYLSKTTFIAGSAAGIVVLIIVVTVVVIVCRRRRRNRRQPVTETNSQIVPAVAKSTAYTRMV
ncbi:trophoblast glycoprotein-like [Ruditapes philippinarum]|uniref:trophoblast glycoprotein-like n=1 Tax=Ruditapes philippinarum TaxID=129788 RepID=UPI00295AAD1D|nr:trophoblast glycoprotein-like [Ruditapes philippinarum]